MQRDWQENARTVETAIDALDREYNFPGLFDHLVHFVGHIVGRPIEYPDFDRFWAEVRQINLLFKDLPMQAPDRKALRERLSRLCETAKDAKRDFNDWFGRRCDENRDEIRSAIRNLIANHDLEWVSTTLGSGPNLKGFSSDQHAVRDLFKTLKPIRRSDREELWNELNKLCDKAAYLREQINNERHRKNHEWRSRMDERIGAWNEQVTKKNGLIDRVRDQIAELADKRREARTADFADKVQSWIDEKERFIDELNSQIRDIESKITDVESKLEESARKAR